MAGNFLSGLVKGLSGFMPQDDPEVKLLNAQSELSDYREKEAQIYGEIGKQAIAQYGVEAFGELAAKLTLLQSNIATAEAKLQALTQEKEADEARQKEAQEKLTCSNCGALNPDGTKFCQECGTKLGIAAKQFCNQCGAELAAGTRFCGTCGARQEF